MFSYITRRLLLIIPTLLGIMTINFFVIQLAPGGPVDQMIAKLQGQGGEHMERVTQGQGELVKTGQDKTGSRGARGMDPELVKEIERLYGFDRPILERYFKMLKSYIMFDFGESFFRGRKVTEIIIEKLPVSISIGVWSTLLIYLLSIPLGIKKAVKHGSKFDVWTSTAIITGNAVPGFLFAVLLIVLFAGGNYFSIFPLKGLTSDNFSELSAIGKILDYFWHLALPVGTLVIGGMATLTMLTKNSFLDEIGKQYVTTAKAKGLEPERILYGHVFRNAMLLVISGFPAAFVSMFLTGSLLIEVIFSLDGLGLLGFESTLTRDYPVMFGSLYIFTLIGLVTNLVSDITYVMVDPRIDFASREK
jgi:microcin C transport system permease protein